MSIKIKKKKKSDKKKLIYQNMIGRSINFDENNDEKLEKIMN